MFVEAILEVLKAGKEKAALKPLKRLREVELRPWL